MSHLFPTKRVVKLILVLTLLLSCLAFLTVDEARAQTASANLITNPNFDNGMNGWHIYFGTSQVIEDPLDPGTEILRVSGNGRDSVWQSLSTSVEPDTNYTLTGEGRLSTRSTGGSVSVHMEDANGKLVSSVSVPILSTSFTTFQLQFKVPPTTKTVLLYLNKLNGISNYVDFDNISLTETAEQVSPSAVHLAPLTATLSAITLSAPRVYGGNTLIINSIVAAGSSPASNVVVETKISRNGGKTYSDTETTIASIAANATAPVVVNFAVSDNSVNPSGTYTVTQTILGQSTSQTATFLVPPDMGQRNGGACSSMGTQGVQNGVVFYDWLGRKSAFAMDYVWYGNWTTTLSSSLNLSKCWRAGGYTNMMMGVGLIAGDGVSTMAAGVKGDYDNYYKQIAQNLITAGYPNAIIRLGWEFNGYWYAWSTQTADGKANFVPLFQRIVTIMRAVPGANFKFDWCYAMGSPTPDTFYPGDDYVDIVGTDVYDRWWGSATATPAQRWNTWLTMNYGFNWLANFAATHKKPISIAEWGLGIGTSGSMGDDPAFIQNMANWIASNNIAYTDVWNEGGDEMDIPTTQVPLSAAVFKTDFGD